MIRPVLRHPDPLLRRRCAPVGEVTEDTRALVRDLIDTMYDLPSPHLAAPEVGVLSRVFVLDAAGEGEARGPRAFADPRVAAASREIAMEAEGCPSVPGAVRRVARPRWVVLRWTDLDGAPREERFEDAWAVGAQHGMDHLEGRLILDHGDAGGPDRAPR